uniref:Uncharacterized protein n=1 Tax=Strix occidentalis caurina TaxID=311401 RepID=A0A8D0F8Z4_STROC
MQVSFVCSEHSIKSRSAEDRLNRQNAGSPSLGTRGKFRAVQDPALDCPRRVWKRRAACGRRAPPGQHPPG